MCDIGQTGRKKMKLVLFIHVVFLFFLLTSSSRLPSETNLHRLNLYLCVYNHVFDEMAMPIVDMNAFGPHIYDAELGA